MKKILLIVMAVIGFAGMSVAQDIYSSGYYVNSDNRHVAAVYKNDELLYERIPDVNYSYNSTDLDFYNGSVYWVRNCMNNDDSFNYGDVYLNDMLWLSTSIGSGSHIYDLYRFSSGNESLWSVGCTTINGVKTAARWRNNDASAIQLGDGVHESVAFGATGYGDLYTCGYQYTSANDYHGVIWQATDVLIEFEPGTKLYGITFYNGYFWSVGTAVVDGTTMLKVWSTNINTLATNERLTLAHSNAVGSERTKIFIDDAGDIFVTGQEGSYDRIWRDGFLLSSTSYYYTSVWANSTGFYWGGSGYGSAGAIWKDGDDFYAPNPCDRITNIFVDEQCEHTSPYTLPFNEGFETGDSNWPCWTIVDVDGNNGIRRSSWTRLGSFFSVAATGEYCAVHDWGPADVPQEGWLISPGIDLQQTRGPIQLSFKTNEFSSGSDQYCGVWISTTGTDLSDFTEIWSQNNFSNSWKDVTLDLSDYQGDIVYIAFKYSGTRTHDWYIDDVSVAEAAPTQYTILTNVNPAGAGTVDGAGIYSEGETVYLTASANQGWQFSHWNDGITSNPRSITVIGDATYTANFIQLNYTLTVNANPAEGGIVTGGGTNYHYGDEVTLTATANSGFVFSSWSDGDTNATRTVTVTGNATYTAFFIASGATMYTVTVVSNSPFLGSVSGSGTYPEGSVIQISATPSSQGRFVSWDDGNTDNPRDVTVTGDMTFTAQFVAVPQYTITVESANPNMGTATGGGNFLEGTSITISATAFSGYYFTGWDDGNADNPRTITVTQNATYKAMFSANAVTTYTLTVMCNPAEGTVLGNGTYTAGTTVTIAAIPNSGYAFDRWNDGSSHNPREVTVNDNMVFVAFFKGTGVDENEGNIMVLYPNPATDNIHIEGIEANTEVRIYNAIGGLVKVTHANPNEEIGIGELSAGLYLLRCGNATMRFVKVQ